MSPIPRAANKQEQPHVQAAADGATALGRVFALAEAILHGAITDALKEECLPAGAGIFPL